MGHMDHDRPDDSNAPRHTTGFGRAKKRPPRVSASRARSKDAAGEMTDDESLEEKGERENAAGNDRQKKNDAV